MYVCLYNDMLDLILVWRKLLTVTYGNLRQLTVGLTQLTVGLTLNTHLWLT